MSNSRLDELRMVDPVLTTIAQGYENASAVSQYLFPTVAVRKMKGKIPKFGKEAFLTRDTRRGLRASSNRIPPAEVDFIEYETSERDIEVAVDYLEEEESYAFEKYERRLTKDLVDILLLGKEKDAADLAQDSSNYATGLSSELTASDAWDDYDLTSVDPVSDIKDAMSAVRQVIGRYPNTMIIGDSSYQALINHPKVLEKVQYSGLAKVTKNVLKELLDLAEIQVGMSVYSTDGESFIDVWSDNAILAYVDRSGARSEFNPSFGYAPRKEGSPEVDSYYESGGKIKAIRCTDNYAIKITAEDAAYLIKNTNHV